MKNTVNKKLSEKLRDFFQDLITTHENLGCERNDLTNSLFILAATSIQHKITDDAA